MHKCINVDISYFRWETTRLQTGWLKPFVLVFILLSFNHILIIVHIYYSLPSSLFEQTPKGYLEMFSCCLSSPRLIFQKGHPSLRDPSSLHQLPLPVRLSILRLRHFLSSPFIFPTTLQLPSLHHLHLLSPGSIHPFSIHALPVYDAPPSPLSLCKIIHLQPEWSIDSLNPSAFQKGNFLRRKED